MNDYLNIIRVANGWVIKPGQATSTHEYTFVARTPAELAEHVLAWANEQVASNRLHEKDV